MSKLSKADVALNGIMPSVVKLIKEWKPGALNTEVKYRDSLLAFLRASVPDDCRVEREYRHGGTTVDLWLSWKGVLSTAEVFIELKRDLQQKAAFDRLVGQIEGMDPSKRKIIIVLVGRPDPGLVGRIKTRYEKYMDAIDEDTLALVIIE